MWRFWRVDDMGALGEGVVCDRFGLHSWEFGLLFGAFTWENVEAQAVRMCIYHRDLGVYRRYAAMHVDVNR